MIRNAGFSLVDPDTGGCSGAYALQLCCTALSGAVRSIIFNFITTGGDISGALSYVSQLLLTWPERAARDAFYFLSLSGDILVATGLDTNCCHNMVRMTLLQR